MVRIEGLCQNFNPAGGMCNFPGPEKPSAAKERRRNGRTYWLCRVSNGGAIDEKTLEKQGNCDQNPSNRR